MKTWIAILMSLAAFTHAHAQGTEIIYLNSEENQFYQLINQFRSQIGLPQLQMHVYIQSAAKKHSEWMASQDFLTHYGPVNNKTPFQRMEEEGYVNYTYAGENVACGYADAIATFRQWAFSPQHLANMINPHFHHMGISRAGTGREYCPYYWTNDFGSFTPPKLDPAAVTDLNKIAKAIEDLTGGLNGNVVQLPSDQSSQAGASEPASNTNTTLPSEPEATLIQCMVPYRLGKGLLTFYQNTDTIVEAVRNTGGGYVLKLSYLQNGQSTNFAPVYLNSASILKNPTFPLYLIFAAPGSRVGGFSIQYNIQTNQAQFDPYGSGKGASGSILCSSKDH